MAEHTESKRVPVKASHEFKVIRADGSEEVVYQRTLSDEEAMKLLAWAEVHHPEYVAEARANAEKAKENKED